MIEDAPTPVVTPEKVREQRWIFLALFLVIFVGMCAAIYGTWGDATGQGRLEAKLIVFAMLCIVFPVGLALMLRGIRTRPYRKRRTKNTPSTAVIVGISVVTPLLRANPSWEP